MKSIPGAAPFSAHDPRSLSVRRSSCRPATPGANPEHGGADLAIYRNPVRFSMGFGEPLTSPREAADLAERGVSFFAMELVPRITRAQSMDALSSMATIAGYEAVLMAATTLPQMFPMMMTAAGTITPAKVLRARRGRGGPAGDRDRAAAGRGGVAPTTCAPR